MNTGNEANFFMQVHTIYSYNEELDQYNKTIYAEYGFNQNGETGKTYEYQNTSTISKEAYMQSTGKKELKLQPLKNN